MPTLLIAMASALLLAALVTEATSRFWPDSYLALLFISFIALMINGLFNARLKQNGATTQPSAPADQQRRQDTSANRGKQNNRRDRDRDRDRERDSRGSRKDPSRDKSAGRSKAASGEGREKSNRGSGRDGNRDASREKSPSAKQDNAPTGPLENGEVKWFNRSKGYGFIIRENGDEIFVHQRSIVSQGEGNQRPVLRDGQKVSFVVSHQDKGAQAEKVSSLD